MSGAGKEECGTNDRLGRAFSSADPGPGALHLDHSRYAEHLADMDISEEDARAFIETLWSVMVAFVDIGWGVDAVQQACGQSVDALVRAALEDADALQLKDRKTRQKTNGAGRAQPTAGVRTEEE